MDSSKQSIREEWRKLGFFYEINESEYKWRFVGSKQGLLKFYNLLLTYAANPINNEMSEHEHYGPYMYLEIMTWDKPGIDNHAIYGSIKNIQQLASLFKAKVESAKEGEVLSIGKEYAPESKYSIVIEIQEHNFDPASVDSQLREKGGLPLT